MGQTPAPEATMDTLHFPGGEDKDSTKVQKGASLSFQSLTSGAELYYIIGDGSGVTHSLSHASASGVYVARKIAEKQ